MKPMMNACIICHKKKVKCDLGSRRPCSNCTRAGKECIMYSRKRKKYTNSLSPRESKRIQPAVSRHNNDSTPSYQTQAQTQNINKHKRSDVIETYRGRDLYLGRHVSFDEAIASPSPYQRDPDPGSRLSPADLELLTHQGAFQLPPKYIQDEYIAAYMQYCNTWTPIVDPAWLHSNGTGKSVSYLLLQSILLAASRVTKQPCDSMHGSTADFYRRAKLLFFFGHERDPLISIVSAVLLHWYNPVGPETISTDTSGFWLRTAEAIAFQVGLHKEPGSGVNVRERGLRRRLWWTLVVRDCVISAGVGRPRTINLRDSDVLPLCLDDFGMVGDTTKPRLFLVYASVCQLLGEIVEGCLRPQLQTGHSHHKNLENSLYCWVKQDFRSVQSPGSLYPDLEYSFEARQILVTYFSNLIILDRSPTSDGVPSARSFIASSFISGIYKQFLDRDELCRLGPISAFYALCAGLALLPAIRFPILRRTASDELCILINSLRILSKQWGSAFGALRALQKLSVDISHQPLRSDAIPVLEEMIPFFEDFGPSLCRQWDVFFNTVTGLQMLNDNSDLVMTEPLFLGTGTEALPQMGETEFSQELDVLDANWEGVGFDWSGSWLLDDAMLQMNSLI